MQIGRLGIGSAIAGGVLGVASMVGIGISVQQMSASAQTPPGDTPSATAKADRMAEMQARQAKYLESLASNLGVSVDALKAANLKTQLALVDQAVADGKITADQATQMKAHITESGGAHLGGPGPRGGHGPGMGHRPGGEGHRGPGGPRGTAPTPTPGS